jgi:6-hydroxynicotinate 3-monooxygenase
MTSRVSIAVIGAGMGGLTAAALLHRAGMDVNLYEQAERFSRVGAGIQMSPNAMKVLRKIDLEPGLREIAFQPGYQLSREWDTGNVNLRFPMGSALEERHGAPYLLLHRGDLHAQLTAAVPEKIIHRGKRLVSFEQTSDKVQMQFADGSSAEADMMIAADGVHSLVRELLFGASHPHYSGRVAHRTTFPAALLNGDTIADCTKWWGPDRHIVIYYTTRARDEIYFVTSVPEEA